MSIKKILKKSQPKISQKVGLPPGTIVYTGQPKEDVTNISLFQYDKESSSTAISQELPEVIQQIDSNKVKWINFDSLHDVELITAAGSHFNIHNLTLEDIVHVGHIPKLEEYDDYLFLTLK